ncbi:Alcohol dehydrogenase [NADP(+)] [Blattella germanica]|nr:Alcohol dehydrogenase [NADP(+)] [Blattella germanica]
MATNSVLLRSGQRMPLLGLGTWQAKDEEIERSVETALEEGYRHIDTAFNYNNEEAIGRALKRWIDGGRLRREELFITTKLPHIGNRASDVENFLEKSLSRLQLEYVDMYLVHVPFGFVPDNTGENPAKNNDGTFVLDDTDHVAVWKPAVPNWGFPSLPIRLLVHLAQKLTLNKNTTFNTRNDINAPDILQHPLVKDIANAHQKSTAQVLLRHLVQQGIIVIPKSVNPHRIKENGQIFDFQLTPDEMLQLNGLDLGENGRIINFLFWKGVEKHPEYPFKLQSST